MFNKKSSRHSLALFVALTLGSGAFLAPSAAGAADVSGQDVTIDNTHPTVAADRKVGTDGAAGGAITNASDPGNVTDNTLTLTKHAFSGRLYGGYTAGSGNVTGNRLFIHNIISQNVQEKVFGGHANDSGHATGNTVTLTGGRFLDNIYGGSSVAGNATDNTVNLGDGTNPFQGSISGTIYGGDGPGTGDYVTGNTLNVNTSIIADNIKNFATINFNYNSTVSAGAMLQLDDASNKRTSVDWNGIHLTGIPDKSLTLMANLKGIDINNYGGGFKQLTLTDTHEAFIAPGNQIGLTRYQRINYERNQFAGVRKNNVNTSDGTPGIDEIDVYGGESKIGNTTTNNEVTITNAPGHGKVYGGYTEGDGTTADVAKRYDSKGNKVTITGGAASELYGGYTSSSAGIAAGNTVTIKGGTVRANIYGGYSVYGDATGNTINLGDGTSTSAGTIQGEIFGGRSTVTTKDQTTGNTLNVNANAAAKNIWNFSTINFNFSAHVNPANTLLTLNGTQATKLKSLDQLHVKDVPRGEGTLMENANGININEYSGAAKRTAEKTETVIDKDGATKISYKGYQFKDSTSVRTAGTDTWGGRSVIGNTTTNNHISLTSGSYTDIYGGWTSGTGSTATGIDATNQSIDNSVTLEGASAHKLTGGKTESGDARENRVVVRSGSVTGNIRGGIASGKASGNSVDIGGGAVTGQIYGGDGDAEASGNIITITKGTINGDIIGGYSQNGAAKGNTVNLGDGRTSYTATINGKLIGGQTTFGSVSNNILNIKANASATNIEDFETYRFHLSCGTVNKANTLLTLTDGTGTNLDSLDHIDVEGTLNGKATLMANTHGISLGSYASAVVKTHGNKEAVIDTDNHTAHAQTITYEGYQFAQKDTTTTVTESGVTSTWGGRSVGSNSTHHNDIAVESDTHTNVYGGWTSGSGTTAADKDTSYKNKVKVSGSANVTNTVYGGFTEAANGKATGNEVTIGNAVHNVVGGQAAGEASGNTVTVSANANAVTGGRSTGEASNNTVNLSNATVNSVTGGEGAATNNNTINLKGNAQVTGALKGGSAANGTSNTLNVKGKDNKAGTISNIQNMNFDASGLAKDDTMLEITGAAQSDVDWTTLTASGTATKPLTLLKNDNGINLAGYTGAVKSETGETTETNIDVRKTGARITEITYEGYQFKDVRQATTVTDAGVTNTFGGRSKAGNSTRDNEITVESGTHTNVYGGWTSGAGTTAEDKNNSYKNKVTVNGSASVTNTVYGGFTEAADGKATDNEVTIENAVHDVVGGQAAGEASGNTVTVSANANAVTGGRSTAEASNNTVNLANAMVNSVTGGEGATTKKNIVNLNGGVTVNGAIKGGTGTPGAAGEENKLNVKGTNSAQSISDFQKLHFDTTGAIATNPLLNITGGATNLDWNTLDASGTSVNRTTLLKNTAGITLTNHTPGTVKSKINEAGTTEYNIDVEKTGSTITDITYQGYQFKGKTTATTEGTDTYGGRSKAGNTTTENELTVDSGNHTNIYGGWTSGAGSSAAPDKQKDSIGNKVTVKGTAAATGDVIGGLTDVADGKATGNTVTVEKNLTANIIGGKATAEASSNIVNLANATVNSVTGGEGAATNNNIVNLNGGANVTGYVKGGTQANGAGNTLNVKGVNSAGTISGFQKLHFDTEGASTTNPLLNITGSATNLDWNTLDASGTSVNRVSLLKNAAGITLTNHTPGTVKSKINEAGTTEYNIDVEKTGSTITDITYQGYQFKGKTTATTEGTDTYGGRSKAGNTTTENELTVDSGSHTNIYGGWTSGAGSTADAAKQKDSIGNKVTVKGTAAATGDVIGGLTDVADGKATGNTVTVEKDLAANIIGGKAASGDASNNTVNLANATVNSLTGGEGAATNNNTINLNGNAEVSGTLTGGSQASGTGNTLNVKGKDNKAGTISNIQNMNFDATSLAKDDTMLEATGAGTTTVNWANLKASGTAAKPLTLLKNANGINLMGYTGAAKSETGETTETNIDVRKTGGTVTEITYEGYQFKDVRQATTVTDAGITNTFGGRSKAGNSTRENEIAVESGTHTNVYGGWTSGSGSTATDKDNSYKNTVTVKGAANVTNTLYGGYTEAAGGKATENTVTVEKDLATANIIGGKAAAEASDNIVNLANATVNSLTGGEGAMTNNNIVNLKGNAQVTGTLTGGSAANGTGNTLNVTGTNNKAGSIAGFQKLTFDAANADANPMLQVTGGAATDVDWTNLTATGTASETPKTLMENAAGINTNGRTGDAARSELNADATMETNIDVVKSGDKVTALTYEGYTFKGSTKTTTYGADTWAGRSKAGNTTQDNTLTLDDASKSYANVYGGWTSGTGTKATADKQNNSLNNTVDYTAGTVTGTLYGGYAANGEASGNTVNLGAVTTAANIIGGFGTMTNNNTINLNGARVTGTVTGGSAANGTGNTLAVYKPSEVQDFAGVQNLHFHTDELTAGTTTPLLKLGTTTKDIRGLNIGVDRSGDAPKLKKGDKLLLMKTAGGDLTTDDKIENKIEGKQGMARRYTYEIKKENTGELTATVTHAGLGDDAKSPVETRAGLSNLVNQGADYIVESSISAAETALRTDAGAGSSAKSDKSAQRKTAATDNASYQLWAGAGANTMRVESGSHVDSKGWSLGVGWAREDEMKDGAKRLFSPFVEYGRGSYDSYLDNGAHGSGTIRYLGIGVLGKLTQKDGLWLEGSVRGGRATSDYQLHGSSDANYDGSNTYYGIHLGIGKTVELRKDATIDAYARYFWSHQNGMSVKLSSGDDYDFASVDSHRLRLGFRYSQKDQQQGEFYTGLAWEYEFDGEARASIGGDAAPSPSLKGSSTMLELGYRFMPENSRVSYDLHLNGWQGKRKGISGGVAVKWAF